MNDTQKLIGDSIRGMLGGTVDSKLLRELDEGRWSRDLWDEVAASEFHLVLAAGGVPADDFCDALPILHALGYYSAPVPLAETIFAQWLLAVHGLPLSSGIATVGDGSSLTITGNAVGGFQASGSMRRIPWARAAESLVVQFAHGDRPYIGLMLFQPSSASLVIDPGKNLASEPRDTVVLDACPLAAWAPLDARFGQTSAVMRVGALARAAMMTGAAESMLDQTIRYTGERIIFGRPIARFQAAQHQLAELACEVAAANTAISAACMAPTFMEVAVAKTRVGHAANRAVAIAHQLHGAIGFTYEYALQFNTRRLWSWQSEFGGDAFWAREIGRIAIEAGGDKLWPTMTAPIGGF